MQGEFAVVDLFAGPGGLAEGFSSIQNRDGSRPFRIVLSIEKEAAAFETLRLRSFLRQFDGDLPRDYYRFLNGEVSEPQWSEAFPAEWERACQETAQLELGSKRCAAEIDARLAGIKREHRDNIILIGGPPCQAYSLVGRARNKGTEGYDASKDHRHFLYLEYIRILERLMPAAFVMENVKGLLSSSVDGERIFDKVLDDLSAVGNRAYRLIPLTPRSAQNVLAKKGHPPPIDFVVRAEHHGVPQARHRVIVVGIRSDLTDALDAAEISGSLLSRADSFVTVKNVLAGMPKLRSGLSKFDDNEENWREQTSKVMRHVSAIVPALPKEKARAFRRLGKRIAEGLANAAMT